MGPDILRAVVAAGRESRVSAGEMRARLERAWSGLSRAEQLALGGTLAAALLAGGGMLVRSGLNATRPWRRRTTKDLLRLFEGSEESQKDAIAEFCVCRVHDVRELLFLDDNFKESARQVLDRILALKKSETREQSTFSHSAQISFLEDALSLADKYPHEYYHRSEMQVRDGET